MLLIGPSGAGKSTFAAARFEPTQVLASDFFRAMISDDEGDQSSSPAAFAILHRAAAARLRRGLLTVIDATNLLPRSRARLLAMAVRHGRPAAAVVFDVALPVLLARAAAREGRAVPPGVVARQRRQLERTLAALPDEGYAVILRAPET